MLLIIKSLIPDCKILCLSTSILEVGACPVCLLSKINVGTQICTVFDNFISLIASLMDKRVGNYLIWEKKPSFCFFI